ncbi:potassium transporter TrkA [Chitinispirillum alkaliphilum]|nr:potassium transporter TrkA [Chitinispirillum alkaliphilum]
MAGIITLFAVLSLSLIITRIASIALVHTGLSRESARFQARSAFSGVGFTTREAESVVSHPVRRRIVMVLMLLGNAGVASAVASLLLTFYNTGQEQMAWYYRVLIIFSGILVLWKISSSEMFDRWFGKIISKALQRWTDLTVRDYSSLLHLAGDYQITEMIAEHDHWIAGKSLIDMALSSEGIMVLGIKRKNGTYIGAPGGNTFLRTGDVAILYGQESAIHKLGERMSGPQGDVEHLKAVEEFQKSNVHKQINAEK